MSMSENFRRAAMYRDGCIDAEHARALLRDDSPAGKMIVPEFTPEQLAQIEIPLRPVNVVASWRMKDGQLIREDYRAEQETSPVRQDRSS